MGESSGLVDIVFAFGVVLAFLIWQLVVTRRGIRQDRESARRAASDEKE
jgi:uncharacterized membrane protein YciS (DUF1049 family)